jgi:hypothetical protein
MDLGRGRAASTVFIFADLVRTTAVGSLPIARSFLYLFSSRVSVFVRLRAESVLMMHRSTL